MIITIATAIPTAGMHAWDWKFYLCNGRLCFFTDNESVDYEAGFKDALALLEPRPVIDEVTIEWNDVENYLQGDADNHMQLLQDELNRRIPLGVPTQPEE